MYSQELAIRRSAMHKSMRSAAIQHLHKQLRNQLFNCVDSPSLLLYRQCLSSKSSACESIKQLLAVPTAVRCKAQTYRFLTGLAPQLEDFAQMDALIEEAVEYGVACQRQDHAVIEEYYLELLQLLEACIRMEVSCYRHWIRLSAVYFDHFSERGISAFLAQTTLLRDFREDQLRVFLVSCVNITAFNQNINTQNKCTLVHYVRKIFHQFTVEEGGLEEILQILLNIVFIRKKQSSINIMIGQGIFEIVYQKMRYLSVRNLEKAFKMLGQAFSISSETGQKLLLQCRTIIPQLKYYIERYRKEHRVLRAILFTTANMLAVGVGVVTSMMIAKVPQSLFGVVSEVEVRDELAVILHNMVMMSIDEQLEVLCDVGLLTALQDITEDMEEELETILRTFVCILKRTQHFPTNNIVWFYDGKKVAKEFRKLGLLSWVERLCDHEREEVAEMARDVAGMCVEMME